MKPLVTGPSFTAPLGRSWATKRLCKAHGSLEFMVTDIITR